MGKKRKQPKTEEEIRRKIRKLEEQLANDTRPSPEESSNYLQLPTEPLDLYCDSPEVTITHYGEVSPRPPSPGPSSLIPLSPHAVSPCVSPQLASTQPPQAPQPGTSKEKDAICSDELEEELGEDILKLLGDAPKAEVPLGPFIHKDIASRWQDILAKGLPKDIKEGLLKDYLVPGNCDLLLAPALNPEVKAALPDILVKRDSSLLYKQKQLGVALSALASVMEMVITNESSKQKILKPLSDACRILCDSHYVETKIRRKFVVSSINAKLKDALVETNRDKFLFGDNVSDKLKTAKTIQQSGESLKNSQKPKFQRPNVASTNTNKGRLNYFPQHRKTDNKINDNRRPINPAQRQSQATSARRPTDRPLPVRAAATHRR